MNDLEKRRPGEFVFALLLLIASLAAFREAYMISGFAGLTTGGVMPMLAAGVMIASGLAILREVIGRRASAPSGLGETVAFLLPARLVKFAGLLILYAAAIPWPGFIAASAAFLFVSIAVLWRRGLLWTGAITLVSIASVYVIFRLVFQVVLPMGTLWQ